MPSTVIPALRYRDAKRAVAWLQDAFGFEPRLVVDGPDGNIAHAQLTSGDGMVMFGSAGDGDFDLLVAPLEHGVRPSGSVYVVVADVTAHAERARTAGARIVVEPEEQDYGGSLYICLDFEGNVWSFGSYDPWSDG